MLQCELALKVENENNRSCICHLTIHWCIYGNTLIQMNSKHADLYYN